MFRLIIFLGLVALILVAIVRGWVSFSWLSGDDKSRASLTIDRDKIKEDISTAKEKARQLSEKPKAQAGKTVRGKVVTMEKDRVTVDGGEDVLVTTTIVPGGGSASGRQSHGHLYDAGESAHCDGNSQGLDSRSLRAPSASDRETPDPSLTLRALYPIITRRYP
jgi:hypothetical protein